MLSTIPDVPTLAKNYVHAQRLVGTDRMPAWKSDFNDQQRQEFYSKAGRPEKPEAYTLPEDVKFEDGVKLDDAKFNNLRKVFHDEGFTPRQAQAMLRTYVGSLNETTKEMRAREEAEATKAATELKQEYGDKFDENIALSRAVLAKVGSPELIEYLNTSRLGNNPHLIRAMVKVGNMITEDRARSGAPSIFTRNADVARAEIAKLSGDMEFQKMLNDRSHPGHKEALSRWEGLFQQAHPGKQADD